MKYTRLVKPKSCSKQVRVFGSKVKQMTRVRKYTQHDYHISGKGRNRGIITRRESKETTTH